MSSSYVIGIVQIFLYAVVHFTHGLEYSDLEALGIACPQRDRCEGYKNDTIYLERNCECGSDCHIYKDCCIDVGKPPSGQAASPSNMICLNYGENIHSGIYAVSRCSDNWNGPKEVEQNCKGSIDFNDPSSAAPLTSASEGVTYKNRYCAECNNADMKTLTAFHFYLLCEGLDDMSQEQIMTELSFDQQKKKWGVNRVDAERNSEFKECQTVFDLPKSLRGSVRFCRANIISQCAADWTRPQEKNFCEEYMAVVYNEVQAYRNPHCAICNHNAISGLSCTTNLHGRKRPIRDLPDERRAMSLRLRARDDLPWGHPLLGHPARDDLPWGHPLLGHPARDNLPWGHPLLGHPARDDLANGDLAVDVLFRSLGNRDNSWVRKSKIVACSPDEKYDPFAQKCRRIVCALPTQVLRDGRCVLRD